MSQIKVDSITNTLNDGPVNFPQGLTGDASRLTLAPQIISFSPGQVTTNVGISTNITLTFDQTMQFSGVGTIRIRSGSASGTIIESFTCGVSAGATISGTQLIINPTSDLNNSTKYYVTLPSVGIANTLGAYYSGTESYFFNTQDPQFSAQGGTYVYTLNNPVSPTGFYKYHIFTSSGILTTSSPSVGSELEFMMVAGGASRGGPYSNSGGGGAGGVISRTGPTLALSAGTYTVTVGAGGGPTFSVPGNSTRLSTSPTSHILTAIGGGTGGMGAHPNGTGSPGGSGGGGGLPAGIGGPGTPGQGNPGGSASGSPTAGSSGGGGGSGGAGSSNGTGGNGTSNPAFNSTILSGYIPVMPTTTLSSIGPTGLYGGGGAGSGPTSTYSGGTGGGGAGGSPAPYLVPTEQREGKAYTGGGGAAISPGLGGSGVVMLRYAVPSL